MIQSNLLAIFYHQSFDIHRYFISASFSSLQAGAFFLIFFFVLSSFLFICAFAKNVWIDARNEISKHTHTRARDKCWKERCRGERHNKLWPTKEMETKYKTHRKRETTETIEWIIHLRAQQIHRTGACSLDWLASRFEFDSIGWFSFSPEIESTTTATTKTMTTTTTTVVFYIHRCNAIPELTIN